MRHYRRWGFGAAAAVGAGILLWMVFFMPGKQLAPPSVTGAGSGGEKNTAAAPGGTIPFEDLLQGNGDVIGHVDRLPYDLPASELSQYFDILKHGENSRYMYWVKNNIMNKLRNQHTPPQGLTDVLLELYADKNQDIVVRVYALQHLRPWYRVNGQKDPRIKEAFFDALNEVETEIAGTALLAINYLSRDQEGFETDAVLQHAIDMIDNPATCNLNRITAVQIAASLQGKTGDATPYIALAESGNPMAMRLAAIAAMGDTGDQTCRALLAEYAELEAPVSTAARKSIEKLDKI